MRKITTEEQSKRLKELGVPCTSCDAQFNSVWSVGDLLDLLPKHLDDCKMNYYYPPFQNDFEVWMRENPYTMNGELKIYYSVDRWIVDYELDGFFGRLPQGTELVDALVRAIELFAANGYDFKAKSK